MVRSGPTRVVLTRGGIPAEQRSRIEAALAAVRAERPAHRDLDFAALGISPSPAALQGKDGPKEKSEERREKKPARELHADGRTFTDRAAGFSVRLPARHEGWTIVPAEEEGPTRVRLVEGEKGLLVEVRVEDLGAPGKLDDVKESPSASGDGKRIFNRSVLHGSKRITLVGSFPLEPGKEPGNAGETGKRLEDSIREIFDGLVLLP